MGRGGGDGQGEHVFGMRERKHKKRTENKQVSARDTQTYQDSYNERARGGGGCERRRASGKQREGTARIASRHRRACIMADDKLRVRAFLVCRSTLIVHVLAEAGVEDLQEVLVGFAAGREAAIVQERDDTMLRPT